MQMLCEMRCAAKANMKQSNSPPTCCKLTTNNGRRRSESSEDLPKMTTEEDCSMGVKD